MIKKTSLAEQNRLAEEQHERKVEAEGVYLTGARVLSEVSDAPAPPLVLGRLDPEGHTILYGPGDVGKGVRASDWIAQLTRQGKRFLIADFEGHPTEWRRRIGGDGGKVDSVMIVEPLSERWMATKSGPLWAVAPTLRLLADDFRADAVVIDSIAMASAGGRDPYAPDIPARYSRGLQQLGRYALSLAHVNRQDDPRYPFGSVFWHNLARTTWSLLEEDGQTILEHRKKGNRPWLGRFAVEVTFDDAAGVITSVERQELDLLTYADRALRDAGRDMKLAEIVAEVERLSGRKLTKTDALRQAMTRSDGFTKTAKGVYGLPVRAVIK